MSRTRNPDHISPQAYVMGRVRCADGYIRTWYRANAERTCSQCAALIRRGDGYTKHNVAVVRLASQEPRPGRKRRRRLPRPVCRACGPFEEVEEEA